MAEFNRQALDAMDEIGSPLQRAITNRQNLERQAAALEMQRRTQVQDQEMRRRQQLEDAARAREEKLADARQSFFERQQLMDKEDKLQRDRILFTEEQKKKARKDVEAERLADRRNAVIAAKEMINKNGVDLGYTLEDINKAGSIGLANYEQQYKQAMAEVMNNKKTRRELENNVRKITKDEDRKMLFDAASDALGFEVTDINEIIDGADKPQLDSILAEYQTDKTVMDNPGAVAQFSQLMQQQFEINNQSGIYDLLLNPNNESQNARILPALADNVEFLGSLKELGASDNDISEIQANLRAGNVKGSISRAGEYMSALVEAYTDIGSKVAAQQNLQIQAKIMDAKEKSGRYSSVQSSISALTRQFPWLWTLSPQEYLTPRQIQQTNQRIQTYGLGQGQSGVINPNAAQGGGGNMGASGGGIPAADLSGFNNALGTGTQPGQPTLAGRDEAHTEALIELGEGGGRLSPDEALSKAAESIRAKIADAEKTLQHYGATRAEDGSVDVAKQRMQTLRTIDNPIGTYNKGYAFTPQRRAEAKAIDDYNERVMSSPSFKEGGAVIDKSWDTYTREKNDAQSKFDLIDKLKAKLQKIETGIEAANPTPPFIDTNPNPPQGLPQGETFGQPIPNMQSTSPEAKAYDEAIRKGVDSGALKIVSPEDAAKRFEEYKKRINP